MFEYFMSFRFTVFFLKIASKHWQKLGLEWLCWLHEFTRHVWKKYIMSVMEFRSLVNRERMGS